MTDIELKKLKRTEPLELLLTQKKENGDLRRQLQTRVTVRCTQAAA